MMGFYDGVYSYFWCYYYVGDLLLVEGEVRLVLSLVTKCKSNKRYDH